MASPLWIRNMLQLRDIRFEELQHPQVYTSQEVAQREHISGHRVAKVVVAMADGCPVELILPASRHVNLDQARNVLHAQELRLASEEEMQKFFTDCEVGAVPPLRHWQDVKVLMDATLNMAGDILFQAGTHEDAVRLNFKDWYEMVNPQVASFSEPAEAVHA